MDVRPGYYTVEDTIREGVTICRVDENGYVDVMNHTPGYLLQDVFGEGSEFKVLAGPWEPPTTNGAESTEKEK